MDTAIILFSSFAFFLALAGISAAFLVQKWGKPLLSTALEAYWSGRWDQIGQRLQALEEDVGSLPRTWEEFATDAKKAQERARWHVRRVKKELDRLGLQDEEIDSVDSSLRRVDGEGSNGQGMLPLSDAMEKIPSPPADPMNLVLMRKWGSQ